MQAEPTPSPNTEINKFFRHRKRFLLIAFALLVALSVCSICPLVKYRNELCWLYDMSQGLNAFKACRLEKAEVLFYKASLLTKNFELKEMKESSYRLSLNSLADVYLSQGKYQQAKPVLEQSLASACLASGKESDDASSVRGILAGLCRRQGKYDQAEKLYREVIASTEKNDGQSIKLAAYLEKLAKLLCYRGRTEEAKDLFDQSFRIKIQKGDKYDTSTASTIAGLADIEVLEGKYKSAEHDYHTALSAFERSSQLSDANSALNSLATLYILEGRWKEAESASTKAFSYFQAPQGIDYLNVSILSCMCNLTSVYTQLRKFDKAADLLSKAKEIASTRLGPNHPGYGLTLAKLAMLEGKKGNYSQAIALEEQALEIFRKSLVSCHPWLFHESCNLASFYRDQGNYRVAEPLYQKELNAQAKCWPIGHPETAYAMNAYAELLAKTNRSSQAQVMQADAHKLLVNAENL